MGVLDDFRQQYPMYNDIPDADLTNKIYQKFYSDMPRADFDAKMKGTAPVASKPVPGFEGQEMRSSDDPTFSPVTDLPEAQQLAMGPALTPPAVREFSSGFPVVGNYVTKDLPTQEFEKNYPNASASLKALGGVAGTAPLLAIPGGPEMLGMRGGLLARTGAGTISGGTIAGADQFARSHEEGKDFATSLGDAGMAARVAGPIAGILSGLNSMIAPQISPAARNLAARGIPLTTGQIGTGGTMRAGERLMADVPIVGDAVRERIGDSITGFNRAAIDETLGHLPPVSGVRQALPHDVDAGMEGRAFTRRAIQRVYQDAYNNHPLPMRASGPGGINPNLDDQIDDIVRTARQSGEMLPETANRLETISRNQIFNRLRGGTPGQPSTGHLTPEALSTADNELRRIAGDLEGSQVADDRALSRSIFQVRDALRGEFANTYNTVPPNSPPGTLTPAQQIAAADQAWRHYSVLRQAGRSTAVQGVEGYISPKQLQAASQQLDETYAKRATSEGQGTFQRLALDAQHILPDRLPNSGTGAHGASLALGGLALTHPLAAVPALGALGIAKNMTYSPQAQAIMRRLIMGAPETRAAISRVTTPSVPLGVQATLQALQQGQ